MSKPLKLNNHSALRLIRQLAADTNKIVILEHAEQRMKRRKITLREVHACLQKGTITEGPALDMWQNWKVTLARRAAGRELACAVAIDQRRGLLVITVFSGKGG